MADNGPLIGMIILILSFLALGLLVDASPEFKSVCLTYGVCQAGH